MSLRAGHSRRRALPPAKPCSSRVFLSSMSIFPFPEILDKADSITAHSNMNPDTHSQPVPEQKSEDSIYWEGGPSEGEESLPEAERAQIAFLRAESRRIYRELEVIAARRKAGLIKD